MTIEEIAARLKVASRHVCARCLKVIDKGHIDGREGNGTRMLARCHGRWTTAIVPDVLIEDGGRVWWFLHDEGKPYATESERLKRELQAELDQLHARQEASWPRAT